MDKALWDKGLAARKSTLGADYVEKSMTTVDDFNREWQDMLNESRAQAGPSRYVLPLLAPLVRALLKRRGAYWKQPGQYADPWGAVRRKLGDPSPDT